VTTREAFAPGDYIRHRETGQLYLVRKGPPSLHFEGGPCAYAYSPCARLWGQADSAWIVRAALEVEEDFFLIQVPRGSTAGGG
jgi:hypothetical protein